MEDKLSTYSDYIIKGILNYGPKLIAAIAIFFIGLKVIKYLTKIVRIGIEKSGLSSEISTFLTTLVNIGLKVFLVLIICGLVGIDTASFVAVLAAASFAVGLALQGSLANFAAGILILIFKPYKIGDYVEMQDKFGKIIDIQIFNTIMETPGNKTLIIPNGKVIDGVITNISSKGNIRLEMEVTMPYSEDYKKVESVLLAVLKNNPLVLESPLPEIGILSYDSHSILLAVRPFVLPEDYWQVRFETYQQIKKAFHDNQIAVAYSEGVEIGKIGE